jgi:hypothetical protein
VKSFQVSSPFWEWNIAFTCKLVMIATLWSLLGMIPSKARISI